MPLCRIADLAIQLNNRYSYTDKLCASYLCDAQQADLEVSVTQEEIDRERSLGDFSKAYCESVCLYRRLCLSLAPFDAFLLHAAVVETDGSGYAFLGRSGTGKSTHMQLWLDSFPNAVQVVNGDKPIVRRERTKDGQTLFYAYGTPWAGKEGLQQNTRVPLKGLCFLEQAEKNSIRRLSCSEAVGLLFQQLLIPKERESVVSLLDLIDGLIRTVPAYLLKCNISREAAELSYAALTKGSTP